MNLFVYALSFRSTVFFQLWLTEYQLIPFAQYLAPFVTQLSKVLPKKRLLR